MGTALLATLLGIVMGGVLSFILFKVTAHIKVTAHRDYGVLGANMLFGGLGALAANQLIAFGVILLGVSIVPTLIGAIVMIAMSTAICSYTEKKLKKIRN